jgi:hypothetical protein
MTMPLPECSAPERLGSANQARLDAERWDALRRFSAMPGEE